MACWNSLSGSCSGSHQTLSLGQTGLEGFTGKVALHVVEQWLRCTGQLDTKNGQTPQQRQQAAVNDTELFTHEIGHLLKYRGDTDQALAQPFSGFASLAFLGFRIKDD